jgi:hypothetical protein
MSGRGARVGAATLLLCATTRYLANVQETLAMDDKR